MKPLVFNHADYEQLQQKYTQAMELLGLAVEDIKKLSNECGGCTCCAHLDYTNKECGNKEYSIICEPTEDNDHYRWQHADKLEELRGGKADEM